MHGNFNPRSPHGERLKYQRDVNIVIKFQSTLPARGATKARAQRWNRLVISIHAPRTGSDQSPRATVESARHFNPRSPHGERPVQCDCCCFGLRFQSTLPARGATYSFLAARRHSSISIHAPRTGSDEYIHRRTFKRTANFNPRSPHGERLQSIWHTAGSFHISIHAPRTGSDQLYELGMLSPTQFQSTLPARGATLLMPFTAMLAIFQSTLPARGATACEAVQVAAMCVFQSTLPARGATRKLLATLSARSHFNPRSPHGERRYRAKTTAARMKHFNPRSPHGERRPRMVASSAARNFNPRSPHGERPLNAYGITETKAFQSTLPARGATYRAKTTAARMKHFNPRSPHGERLGSLAMQLEYL